MMKKSIILLTLILILPADAFFQTGDERGLEILSLARTAIYGKNVPTNLENLRLQIFSKFQSKSIFPMGEYTLETKRDKFKEYSYSFGTKDQVKIFILEDGEQSEVKFILKDNDSYEYRNGILQGGEVDSSRVLKSTLPGPDLKSSLEHKISFESNQLFPILLVIPLEYRPITYLKYLGKAESPDGKADVISVGTKEQSYQKYFFDENSHRLLMYVMEVKKPGYRFQLIQYYSEPKEFSGITIPTRVKTELKIANYEVSGDKTTVTYTLEDYEEGKIEFELNPKFAKNEFTEKFDPKAFEKRAKNLETIVNEKLAQK